MANYEYGPSPRTVSPQGYRTAKQMEVSEFLKAVTAKTKADYERRKTAEVASEAEKIKARGEFEKYKYTADASARSEIAKLEYVQTINTLNSLPKDKNGRPLDMQAAGRLMQRIRQITGEPDPVAPPPDPLADSIKDGTFQYALDNNIDANTIQAKAQELGLAPVDILSRFQVAKNKRTQDTNKAKGKAGLDFYHQAMGLNQPKPTTPVGALSRFVAQQPEQTGAMPGSGIPNVGNYLPNINRDIGNVIQGAGQAIGPIQNWLRTPMQPPQE